jgi:hypothetical protein
MLFKGMAKVGSQSPKRPNLKRPRQQEQQQAGRHSQAVAKSIKAGYLHRGQFRKLWPKLLIEKFAGNIVYIDAELNGRGTGREVENFGFSAGFSSSSWTYG